MGNLCSNKYSQLGNFIQTESVQTESIDEIEIFDINNARKNAKTINLDSKKIYDEHFKNLLPYKITKINDIIKKESIKLETYCIIYVYEDSCKLKEIDKKYRTEEYDNFYLDKFMDTICEIYKKRGYVTNKDSYKCRIIISWKT